MQMGCRSAACLTYEGDNLACLDALPLLHQIFRVVGIIGLQTVGM